MYILLIETSSIDSFVALCMENKVLTSEALPQKEQSKYLYRAIKRCLSKEALTVKDLDCIHVGNGPGSFTGTRVGVMAAKALSFACHIPLIASCSLERFALPITGSFTIAVHGKSKGFYIQKGEKVKSKVQFHGPPSLISKTELQSLNITNSSFLSPDAQILEELASNIQWLKTSTDITFVAERASFLFEKGKLCTHSEVKTCYLHTP